MRTLRRLQKSGGPENNHRQLRLFNHVYTGVKNDVKRALEVEINKLLNEVPLKRDYRKTLGAVQGLANLMFQLRFGMPLLIWPFFTK